MNPFKTDHVFSPDVAAAVRLSVDLPNLRRIVAQHVATAIEDPRLSRTQRVLLAGSGDSWFAGLSVAPALRRWTGMLVESKTAMELSRYESPLLSPSDLVISVSNSGSSSRARETVLLAKERGALTLGVTGSLTGELAKQADLLVHRPVIEEIGLPTHYGRCLLNFAEYLAVLYALYSFGLALGVKRGRLDAQFQVTQLHRIEAAINEQAAVAARVEPAMAALAAELSGQDTIWVIGAGPSRGTAQYSAAKFHEQMPINGIGVDLEEWAHLEYFLTLKWGARSVVMVIAPPGNSLDRAREIVRGISGAGGRAIVIYSGDSEDFPGAHVRVDLASDLDEWLSPLLYHLPAQLLVLHMAARAGIPFLPLRREDGTWLIAKGIVLENTRTLT